MFNKGKPYVPPPTRSMGTASAHDDLHDLDEETIEVHETPQHSLEPAREVPVSYSHAAEERMAADDNFEEDAIQISPYASQADTSDKPVKPAEPEVTAAPATTASTGGSSGSSWGRGSGGGFSGGGHGGGGFGGGDTPSRPTRESSSVLGNGMTFEGDISGVGQLVIEGTVKGDVRVSQVLINEKGSVEGTVHADVLDVRGHVNGAIIAKQVHLHSTARVEGDVTQEELTIERGARFSGRSTQAKRGEEASTAE